MKSNSLSGGLSGKLSTKAEGVQIVANLKRVRVSSKRWRFGVTIAPLFGSLMGSLMFAAIASAQVTQTGAIETQPELQAQAKPIDQPSNSEFLTEAAPVIQAQVKLIELLAQASQTQDPAIVRQVRNQLILHVSNVERLLRRYPDLGDCADFVDLPLGSQPDTISTTLATKLNGAAVAAFAKLSSAQVSSANLTPTQAYCGLQQTRLELLPMFQRLAIRNQILQREGLALEPVLLVDGSEPYFDPFEDWYFQSERLPRDRYYARLRAQRLPSLEIPETKPINKNAIAPHVIISQKTAIGYTQPELFAVSPPSVGERSFVGRSALLALRSPLRREPYVYRDTIQVYFQAIDAQDYKSFFDNYAGTGFALLQPEPDNIYTFAVQSESYIPALLASAPTLPSGRKIDRTAIATLSNPYQANPEDLFTPTQALQLERGQFELAGTTPPFNDSPLMLTLDGNNLVVNGYDLDYGFIQKLGDLPLEAIGADVAQLPEAVNPALWAYFWQYQPPTQVEAVKSQKRLFDTEKLTVGNTAIVSQIPVELNQTYLLRSVAYDLPEAVTNPRLEISRNFPYLEVANGSDVLIALRPIRTRNGSYTILWRILKRFPSPQLEDLEQYARIR
jgi:hypothetical protein